MKPVDQQQAAHHPILGEPGARVRVERREQSLETLPVQLEHRARQLLGEPARSRIAHALQFGGEPLYPLLELGYSHFRPAKPAPWECASPS